jgi:cold shock protein
MADGTIKTLVTERGFGFIIPEGGGGQDLFFHRTDVTSGSYEALRVGDRVTYELGTDERRGTPKAVQVQSS